MTKVGGPGSRLYEMERQAKLEPEPGPLTILAVNPPKPVTHRRCAHCRDRIPELSNYFQDIPGLGDLCTPCHVEWLNPEEEEEDMTDTPEGTPAEAPKYQIPDRVREQIERCFTYHSPKDDQPPRYNLIRATAKGLALTIAENTPPSREQSLALTKLEEAVMHANAAIARNE